MNEEIIKRYVDGESSSSIAREMNTFSAKITSFLRKSGVKIRNNSERSQLYKIDSNMFEKIDSHEKAYFLGWLFSDGNVYLGAGRFTISITLTEADKHVLDYLNEQIFTPPKKLAYKKERIKISRGKEYLCKPCYKLQIDNKKMCEDLISLGCHPRKSKTLLFPNFDVIPKEYFAVFLRGYFDGDGCVYRKGERVMSVYFDGSEAFCLGLKNFLLEHVGIDSHFFFQNGCHRVQITKIVDMFKLYNYLYQDNGFCLLRKKEKIEKGLLSNFNRDRTVAFRNLLSKEDYNFLKERTLSEEYLFNDFNKFLIDRI